MIKAFIVFVSYTFIVNAIISIFCCIVLHFKPNCVAAFKLLAYSQAPFFGLSAHSLSRICNLEKNCKHCRFWTCSKCRK